MLRRALRNIYGKNFHPMTDIEINLFNEICDRINEAARKGLDESGTVDPDDDFRTAILRNNEVFVAFKVHRMQNDMARLLLDSNGNLKPFEQWQKEVMPVDTHVFRVSERIGLTTRSKTPLQTELTLEKNIPGHLLPLAHHWLILHGRYVCMARSPKCGECGIAAWCRKYAADHRTKG